VQVLQAGDQKLLFLELEAQIIEGIARQVGFEVRSVSDSARSVAIEFAAPRRQAPLLLFDATDPGNLGWFSRCQFYVDAGSGAVLQTPMRVANVRDRANRIMPNALQLQIDKELPLHYRMPGRQLLNEQAIYAIVYNLMNALVEIGVALCGKGIVKPLSGRGHDTRSRT
jgi:hypothetical protein